MPSSSEVPRRPRRVDIRPSFPEPRPEPWPSSGRGPPPEAKRSGPTLRSATFPKGSPRAPGGARSSRARARANRKRGPRPRM
eukprot:3962908-Pyramimonas_sp.AAC.1